MHSEALEVLNGRRLSNDNVLISLQRNQVFKLLTGVNTLELTNGDVYGVEPRYLVHHLQLMYNLSELLPSALSFVALNGVNQWVTVLV